jgi:hypothetical protein
MALVAVATLMFGAVAMVVAAFTEAHKRTMLDRKEAREAALQLESELTTRDRAETSAQLDQRMRNMEQAISHLKSAKVGRR